MAEKKSLSTKLQDALIPISTKVQNMFVLTILRNAMGVLIPITIIGAIYLLVLCFPGLSDHYSAGFLSVFTGIFGTMYSLTIPLIAVYVVIAICYFYAEEKNQNKLLNCLTGLIAFLTVTPFKDGNIDMSWLGSSGLFVGMIVAFVSSWIYTKLIDANITIKLPDSVPPMVSEPFMVIVPGFVIMTVFGIVNYLCALTTYGSLHAIVFNLLQQPLMGVTLSLPAICIAGALTSLLWWCGIHGDNVVGSILTPFLMSALTSNIDAIAKGGQPTYVINYAFWTFFMICGSTLALVGLCAFAKSERLKSVGKMTFIPLIFNIGEPSMFGLPIMGNVYFLFPFVFNRIVRAIISYIAMSSGLVNLCQANIAWTMPTILSGFLATGSISGALLQVVLLAVDVVIYYPFVKAYDKVCCEEEKKQKEAA